MHLLAAAGVQAVKVTNWPAITPAPKPTPDAILAAARELNRATWNLGTATWLLVGVTAAALITAALAARWTYMQLDLMKRNARRDATIGLITSDIAKDFHDGLKFFLHNQGRFDLKLGRERFAALKDAGAWDNETNTAFAQVLGFLSYASTLYATDALDKDLFLSYNGEAVVDAFFIMEPVIMNNIRAGLNDEVLLILVSDCLALHQKRKRTIHVKDPLEGYVVPAI